MAHPGGSILYGLCECSRDRGSGPVAVVVVLMSLVDWTAREDDPAGGSLFGLAVVDSAIAW